MAFGLSIAGATVLAAGISAAGGIASSAMQSGAAADATDSETAQQINGMEASARAGVEANTYLSPYEYTGQMGNYALGNELGIIPGMPEMPRKKDFMYIDPRTGQPVVNEQAFNKAYKQWQNGLGVAAQYGSIKMDPMPQTSDPKYRKKNGKFDQKKFANDMNVWDRQLKGVMEATNTDSQYRKAPDRKDKKYWEPVRNAKGKIVKNPDGTVKKKFKEDAYNSDLKTYGEDIHNAAGQYWNNYAQSDQAKSRGALIKEMSPDDYKKDPGYYAPVNDMESYKKDPGYTPMVYDEASWKQANDPGYLAKKDIITNDAQWKVSGDPTYMAPVNTLADLQKTPGYMFGLNQGLDSAQTSAAAGGSLMSGATLKALSDYGSGYASQKWMDYANMHADRFNQAFNRSFNYDQARASRFNDAHARGQGALLNAFNRGQSAINSVFNRNMQNKQFRFNALMGQQNIGLQAANAQSNNAMQTGAQQQSGYNNIGNTQAQGYLNQAQANSNMFTGIGNAVQTGLGNYAFLNAVGKTNPNASTSYGPQNLISQGG